MPRRNRALLFLATAALVLVSACDPGGSWLAEVEVYQVADGACGEIVFVEKLGSDFASALAAVEARKSDQFGDGGFTLEPFEIEVIGADGSVPEESFFAVRVLDPDTGTHLHAVSEVITGDGDLFNLHWCPD